jgi:uncharacterized surface protein with fasciclin (FAS1) repeats
VPACGEVPGEGPGSFDGLAAEPAATAAGNSQLLTTLATAVGDAGLAETLNGEGPFTVFAPANSAFGKLPAADLDALLADPETLTDVLTYHVVAGEQTADELIEAGSVETVEGQSLTIVESGDSFTVDGAKVLCGNIPVANGVVYVIDEVLLPDSVATPTSGPVGPLCQAIPADAVASLADQPVGTAASNVEQLTTLTTAVEAAWARRHAEGQPLHRVRAGRGRVRRGSRRHAERPAGGLQALSDVLTYHVVAGAQSADELVTAGQVETVQGGELEIDKDGQSFTVNGADVLCGPITVANGTVYLIDSVLYRPRPERGTPDPRFGNSATTVVRSDSGEAQGCSRTSQGGSPRSSRPWATSAWPSWSPSRTSSRRSPRRSSSPSPASSPVTGRRPSRG